MMHSYYKFVVGELAVSIDGNTSDWCSNTREELWCWCWPSFDPFPLSSFPVVKPLIVEDTYLLCPAPILQEEGMQVLSPSLCLSSNKKIV